LKGPVAPIQNARQQVVAGKTLTHNTGLAMDNGYENNFFSFHSSDEVAHENKVHLLRHSFFDPFLSVCHEYCTGHELSARLRPGPGDCGPNRP
jgi:hypothetical protein